MSENGHLSVPNFGKHPREPAVCSVQPNRSSLPDFGLWNRKSPNVLNDNKLIVNYQRCHSQRSPFHEQKTGREFCSVSTIHNTDSSSLSKLVTLPSPLISARPIIRMIGDHFRRIPYTIWLNCSIS